MFTLVWTKMYIHCLPAGSAYGTAEMELFPGNLCKQTSSALINTTFLHISWREDEKQIIIKTFQETGGSSLCTLLNAEFTASFFKIYKQIRF